MLTVVVGQTFHGKLASPRSTRRRSASGRTWSSAPSAARDRFRASAAKVAVPADGAERHRAELVDRPRGRRRACTGSTRTEAQGGAPRLPHGLERVLGRADDRLGGRAGARDKSLTRRIGKRVYDLYYNGPKLHMVVLNTPKGRYWVVNTLLDRLSNETMLAIAKGLRPLGAGRRASHVRSRSSAPATSASSPAPASPTSATTSSSATSSRRRSTLSARRACRSTSRASTTFSSATASGCVHDRRRRGDRGRRGRVRRRRHAADRTPATPTSRRSGPWSTSCRRSTGASSWR